MQTYICPKHCRKFAKSTSKQPNLINYINVTYSDIQPTLSTKIWAPWLAADLAIAMETLPMPPSTYAHAPLMPSSSPITWCSNTYLQKVRRMDIFYFVRCNQFDWNLLLKVSISYSTYHYRYHIEYHIFPCISLLHV